MKKRLMMAILLSWALPAHATSNADTTAALQQCSSAPVQALRFIEVGQASLWRPTCGNESARLEPPLMLEFAYRRAVPGDAFSRAAMAMVERNTDDNLFSDLRQRLEQFNREYRDINDGDRYTLRYLEDGRLELRLNGTLLATEQGHDFARAYLGIWFGPQPYSERLKRQLLAAGP